MTEVDGSGPKVDLPGAEMGSSKLGLLEEDDEFEEFPTQEGSVDTGGSEDEGVNLWEDNWDDDTVEDDFCVQLKKYGRKRGASAITNHSPPSDRSPEPLAKRVCTRPSPTSLATNGHSKKNGNDSSPPDQQPSRRSTRSSRTSMSNNATNSNHNTESDSSTATPTPRTPTRSSARLRSSRKR